MSNKIQYAMELDDLKNTWQKEKEELQDRIFLNEKLIQDLSLDKPKGVFDKVVKTAILGRNLALIYMILSFVFAYKVYVDIQLFIPLIIGGLAMLFSFSQHLSIERPDFSQMNTIELQKSISRFRIHMAKYAKYDIIIVGLWFLTLLPPFLKLVLRLQISYVQLIPILLLIVALIIVFSKDTYKKWDKKLRENEEQLQRIIDFENK